MNGKERYIAGLKKYHKHLEKVILDEYALTVKYINVMAWGYTTTALYVETDHGNYTARLSVFSDEKLEMIKKDIGISHKLHNILPTAEHIRNKDGQYYTLFENKILRLSKHIEGATAFEMDMEQYIKVIEILKKIHKAGILHGDLTPSNLLLSYGKIVGILDFEESFNGPVEYDLARTCVFFWYRMEDIPFREVFDVTLKEYDSPVDEPKFADFCEKHAQNHSEQVRLHKEVYDSEEFWKEDYEFSRKALKEISLFKSERLVLFKDQS